MDINIEKKPKRKTISFTDEYEDEFKYLCNQPNSSLYICELIRKDRLNQNTLDDKIRCIVDDILSKKTIYTNNSKQPQEKIDNDLKDEISDLLDL